MHPHDPGATEFLANLGTGTVALAAFVLTCFRLLLIPYRTCLTRSLGELVESLLLAGGIVFLVVRPFLFQAFYIPSESMEPTLLGHAAGPSASGDFHSSAVFDHVFVNKIAYRVREPRRGEIVVFRAEKKADFGGGHQNENVLVKRLIGIPGDTIELRPGARDGGLEVLRNGRRLDETYLMRRDGEPAIDPERSRQGAYAVERQLRLGPDELFVMGDNRNHSNDGRFWGPLPRNRVIGMAVFRFWPPSRIGGVR